MYFIVQVDHQIMEISIIFVRDANFVLVKFTFDIFFLIFHRIELVVRFQSSVIFLHFDLWNILAF